MGRLGIFVVVALAAGAITFLITDSDEPEVIDVVGPTAEPTTEAPDPTESPTPKEDEPPSGFDRYENDAGYAFDHPEAWSVDERGTAVEILSPDASAVISFGLAPGGDVRTGIGRFLEAIEESYDVREVRGPSSAVAGTARGVSVEGSAFNDDDIRVDFQALVVAGEGGNYAIAVFTSSDADIVEVQSILDSFTTI